MDCDVLVWESGDAGVFFLDFERSERFCFFADRWGCGQKIFGVGGGGRIECF